jgi:hypothetical protein
MRSLTALRLTGHAVLPATPRGNLKLRIRLRNRCVI